MMVIACRISLFDSSERVGEGLFDSARLTPHGASPAEVKGTSIEDIAQVVGKSGRRETGRGPPFWRSERCSHTVEPYEKRIKKECTLCLP